jgi:hypothetical protein
VDPEIENGASETLVRRYFFTCFVRSAKIRQIRVIRVPCNPA